MPHNNYNFVINRLLLNAAVNICTCGRRGVDGCPLYGSGVKMQNINHKSVLRCLLHLSTVCTKWHIHVMQYVFFYFTLHLTLTSSVSFWIRYFCWTNNAVNCVLNDYLSGTFKLKSEKLQPCKRGILGRAHWKCLNSVILPPGVFTNHYRGSRVILFISIKV